MHHLALTIAERSKRLPSTSDSDSESYHDQDQARTLVPQAQTQPTTAEHNTEDNTVGPPPAKKAKQSDIDMIRAAVDAKKVGELIYNCAYYISEAVYTVDLVEIVFV